MRKATLAIALLAALLFPAAVYAHCDSLDGPVIRDARTALEKKDLAPVLKWVKPEHEAELREVFTRTLAVRELSTEAKQLADHAFFETLVRLHRAGEGAAYTGLKPAGSILPTLVEADDALASGSIDKLAKAVSDEVARELRARYAAASRAKAHANESAEAGREYVEAYVGYVHYVEALTNIVHGEGEHH